MVEQPTPSPSAARARRYRKRQHDGARVVPLDVCASDVDALVAYGLVDEHHTNDRAEIAQGIQLLLDALSQDAIGVDFDKLESAT